MRYKGYSYVRRAVEYIENSNERIGAEKLAELSGISYVYLHKLFKKCFDKGISGYINEFYINRAASDRKSTRLNSSHEWISRMPSSA